MSLCLHVNIIHFGQALQVLFITCCLPSTNFLNYHLQLFKKTAVGFGNGLGRLLENLPFSMAVSWIFRGPAWKVSPHFCWIPTSQLPGCPTGCQCWYQHGSAPFCQRSPRINRMGWLLVAGACLRFPHTLKLPCFSEKNHVTQRATKHEVQANVLFFFLKTPHVMNIFKPLFNKLGIRSLDWWVTGFTKRYA